MKTINKPDEATVALLKRTADSDQAVAFAAQAEFARALQVPLRQGVLVGDVVRGLFEPMQQEPGTSVEIPVDLLAPGTEGDYVAYTIPSAGKLPRRNVEASFITIPTYEIGNSIGWLLRFAQCASWNVVARAMAVFQAGVVKKLNDDGFHTLLAAATDRNMLVYDPDAANGQLTKRVISLAKTTMRRNGGGNSASIGRSQLTDIILSPEGIECMRNWGIDQIDEVTRREIYVAGDGSTVLTRIFGVNMHDLVEFGDAQEYQTYFTGALGGSLNGSDVELALGLDMSANDSFVMPIRQEFTVYPDTTQFIEGREGYYTRGEVGFACLDGRRSLLLSY